MTPQLQQAIKLLALSNLEIESFVAEALEANPLLEIGETRSEATNPRESSTDERDASLGPDGAEALDIANDALDPDATPADSGDWAQADRATMSNEAPLLDNRSADGPSLAEYLLGQLGSVVRDRREAMIAQRIIAELDAAGYLHTPLRQLSEELGAPLAEIERALTRVQLLEPTGVGARTLGECLALQAKDADRYDPCMARLIDNLDLVAGGAVSKLKRLCDVDDEDFADMLAELRTYDPKPGCRFESTANSAIVPDIIVDPAAKGGWTIRVNEETLPRLVVNRQYFVELDKGSLGKDAKAWLHEQLGEADWLIRALDQRQKTILKTASEIVKRQDGFFREGISAMKPLTLRDVAEAIEMHESTVSRVTRNKYLCCPRGTFEMKYFFSSGVSAADGEGASSQAVKARIKGLCQAEDPKKVLSDQKLVDIHKSEGFDLARRTVAKYREAIGIGSSAQRRRQKKLENL